MKNWQKVAGWPARLALLAGLGVAGTGLYAWASDGEAAATPAAEAAAVPGPSVAPENVPFTSCPLGCDGTH